MVKPPTVPTFFAHHPICSRLAFFEDFAHESPSFLPRWGLGKFAFHNASDESADAGALSAESVQLGLDPLGELNHHTLHFHGHHLLC